MISIRERPTEVTDLTEGVVELPRAYRPDLYIRAAVRSFIAGRPDLGFDAERVHVHAP